MAKAKVHRAAEVEPAAQPADGTELAQVWADPPTDEVGSTERTIPNKVYLNALAGSRSSSSSSRSGSA